MIIDFHVNLLPDWVSRIGHEELYDETENLRRNMLGSDAVKLHKRTSGENLLREMDHAGIDQAVCFSYQWNNKDRCQAATDYVVSQVAAHRSRLYGLAVVQPRAPDSNEQLSSYLQRPGIIGLKVKPKWGKFSLSDIRIMGPLCEILMEKRKILLTHTTQSFHRESGDHIYNLLTLSKNFPDLKIVAAHLGSFIDVYNCYEPISANMKNIYIDISLPKSLVWLPSLMRLGKRDRYLFSTDFPYTDFQSMIDLVDGLPLSGSEKEAVFSGNALRLLEAIDAN